MTAPDRDDEFEAFLKRRTLLPEGVSGEDKLEPPRALDEIVLEKARVAIHARRQPMRAARWATPVALAATILLCLSIVLNVTLNTNRPDVALRRTIASNEAEVAAQDDGSQQRSKLAKAEGAARERGEAATGAGARAGEPGAGDLSARADAPAASDAPARAAAQAPAVSAAPALAAEPPPSVSMSTEAERRSAPPSARNRSETGVLGTRSGYASQGVLEANSASAPPLAQAPAPGGGQSPPADAAPSAFPTAPPASRASVAAPSPPAAAASAAGEASEENVLADSPLAPDARRPAMAAAPASETAALAKRKADKAGGHPQDPKVWLRQIDALRAQGKTAEADAEMRRFRAAFPNYSAKPAAAADSEQR